MHYGSFDTKIVILIKRKPILKSKKENAPAGIRTHSQKSETEARGQIHINLYSL